MPHQPKLAPFYLKRQFLKRERGMFLKEQCGTPGNSGDHIGT